MRGSDIPYNPVFFAYLIVKRDDIHLFMDAAKLPEDYQQHLRLNEIAVTLSSYDCIEEVVLDIQLHLATGQRIWISPTSNYLLNVLVAEQYRLQQITALESMKAVKNAVEVQGMRNSHVRDGKALCQYFAWLEHELKQGNPVDEISGATKLEEFRSKLDHYMGLSFTTISAFGANGSIIHYSPTPETNTAITTNSLYLCDSGAQFLDGTTDVTRTWHFGEPTQRHKDCFTRVLKGQINMGTAIFPYRMLGYRLDTLARKFLWDVCLDYGHGTGHGIGHFLNVHEGPFGISTRAHNDDPGFEPNMYVSNEPGYYETEQFGVRIEDVVRVVMVDNERSFLSFETITMCPIQTKLIDTTLLSDTELDHVNRYHAKVLELVEPLLKEENDQFTFEWLRKETAAISRPPADQDLSVVSVKSKGLFTKLKKRGKQAFGEVLETIKMCIK